MAKRRRFELILHVGAHDWLRYGEIYEGEIIDETPRRPKPRVRLFKPGDDRVTCDVQATSVREVG